MKKYRNILVLFSAAALINGCSKENTHEPDEMVRVEGVEISIGEMSASGEDISRSVDDFAVNTANDPTHTMTTRTGWNFDLQIYKGTSAFTPYGTASMQWSNNQWVSTVNTVPFFPNYTRQRITVDIYPGAKNATVATDQTDAAKLLTQDLLTLNDPNYRINPAHILANVPVHHKNSMIDFILHEVNESQIASLTVVVGNQTYQPYKITAPGFTKSEYLLILPVGISNPEIHLTTKEGARYVEQIEITTAENVCFCLNLLGLELQLGGITVSNWTYGQALSGEYNVVTTYPTFKGPANASVNVLYDNGLTQVLSFNSRGEFTTKPAGRTILQLNGRVLTNPIVLRSMMIDLNPYLQ